MTFRQCDKKKWILLLLFLLFTLFCVELLQVFEARLDHESINEEAATKAGLHPVRQWRAFGLQGFPGTLAERG